MKDNSRNLTQFNGQPSLLRIAKNGVLMLIRLSGNLCKFLSGFYGFFLKKLTKKIDEKIRFFFDDSEDSHDSVVSTSQTTFHLLVPHNFQFIIFLILLELIL